MIFPMPDRGIVNAGKADLQVPLCETQLWEKRLRAEKPFKNGGRTKDRTWDLSRVKGILWLAKSSGRALLSALLPFPLGPRQSSPPPNSSFHPKGSLREFLDDFDH
jgi:hypothetical protein